MAGSHHYSEATKRRVRERLLRGESGPSIAKAMRVGNSFVKQQRAKLKAEQAAKQGETK